MGAGTISKRGLQVRHDGTGALNARGQFGMARGGREHPCPAGGEAGAGGTPGGAAGAVT